MPVQPYQTSFQQVISDISRDRLDPRAGHLYNLVDYIPNEIDAPLAKRGGWAYASDSLADYISNTVDRVTHVLSAPFSGGHQLLAVARDDGVPANRFLQILSTSSETDRGACTTPTQPLIFYRDKVYLFNTSNIQVYDGSSNVSTMGSTPGGERGCVYKDHLVNARSSGQPQRVWFSAPGDATTWNTVTGFIDTSLAVEAIWALRNAILVFHAGSLERIIGSIPPPGTDMSLQPVWDVGCDQPSSLAGTDQWLMFSNATGVYWTDGTEVVDFTKAGGMQSHWSTLFPEATSRIVAGGFFRGYYFASVLDGSNRSFLDGFKIDVATRRWTRISNITATSMSRRTIDFEELYWADTGEARVNRMGSIFNPTGATKNDADGTAVTPVLELPFGPPSVGLQTVRSAFVRYDIRDSASDNPTLTLSYVTDPVSTSYTAVTGADGNAYPLAETTAVTRVKRVINKSGLGVGLRLAQTNASAQTRIFEFDIDSIVRDPARV